MGCRYVYCAAFVFPPILLQQKLLWKLVDSEVATWQEVVNFLWFV